jgi:DNA-nicking Smr family endonuclease
MAKQKNAPQAVEPEWVPEAPPVMNNPFAAARDRLQSMVPKAKPAAKPAAKPVAKASPESKKPVSKEFKTPATATAVKKPSISDEEIFLREMNGVKPIRRSPTEVTSVDPSLPQPNVKIRPPRSDEAEAYAELADLVDGNGAWDIADTDEYIEGLAPGLDRRLLLRLRQGDYAVQAHLDLHGLTTEEARPRVEQFIHIARQNGQRCVLIVHGRGLNSKDQIPVLKERVRVWLTRGRVARAVLCFATARPTDGGAGAVYVLLRK